MKKEPFCQKVKYLQANSHYLVELHRLIVVIDYTNSSSQKLMHRFVVKTTKRTLAATR